MKFGTDTDEYGKWFYKYLDNKLFIYFVSLKYAEENMESMKDELPLWQFELVADFIGSSRELEDKKWTPS